MKHPLWILNSALCLLLVATFGFVFFSQNTLPERESIEPEIRVKPINKDASIINISKIYENDLFNTYQEPAVPEAERPVTLTLPEPPAPKEVALPKEKAPEFLDPLKITLRGIIIIQSDEAKNRAIITDNKTMQEKNYKIGDKIEDAQLIRILNNKVILLRSNGQQEILYLREKDAILDPLFTPANEWDRVVKKISDGNYYVNPTEFAHLVKNLAQLIDDFNLTTVYEKGKSIGCHVGRLEEKSLGGLLGFAHRDIITSINGVPATDTENRFKIYKNVTSLKLDDVVVVEGLRDGKPFTYRYTLKDFKVTLEKKADISAGNVAAELQKDAERTQKEQIDILQKKYKLAPTVQEIRKQSKETMRTNGRAPLGATNIANE